jgi:hypothetical protein
MKIKTNTKIITFVLIGLSILAVYYFTKQKSDAVGPFTNMSDIARSLNVNSRGIILCPEYECMPWPEKGTNICKLDCYFDVTDYLCKCYARDCSYCSKTCTDSDGGDNKNAKGTISIKIGGTETARYEDSCNDAFNVMEGICSSTNDYSGVLRYCDLSCSNGACLSTPTPVSCSDSDGGNYPNLQGRTTLTLTGGSTEYQDDECSSSTMLTEYYCTGSGSSSDIGYANVNCPLACSNGMCLTEPTPISCVDSDGTNTNTKGTVTVTLTGGSTAVSTDSCYTETSVVEQTCNGLENTNQIINCPYGCDNGACKAALTPCPGEIWDYTPCGAYTPSECSAFKQLWLKFEKTNTLFSVVASACYGG